MSRLAYRCHRVQGQQIYFPQDGWRAIGRDAKELNPELRHRLGVHRYSSSRHSGRPCGPSCAQPPARPGSTLAPSRWNWPHVRAGALGNRRSRRRQESARPPPPLLAQVSRAGDVATTAFPTLALSLFGGMVERKVQLVQPDQGPIAGNLPSPGARRQISALISSALRRPWKRSANASALPLRMRPAVGKARESAVRTSRGELVVGHQGDDSEGMGTKRE